MRDDLPPGVKIATVWLLIGLLVFIGIQWRRRQTEQLRFHPAGGVVELRRGPDDHYHWPGRINGRPADIELEGGVRARRLRVVALPGLVDRPLLGMDVPGRLIGSSAKA